MRNFVSLFVFMFGIFSAAWAVAQPSDSMLRALTNKDIQITTDEGTRRGTLIGFDEQSVIVADKDDNVLELSRETVESIRLRTADDASSKTSSAQHSSNDATTDAEQRKELHAQLQLERRQLERTGAGLRIPGGIVTGVGGITAFSSLVVMAVEGVHYEGYDRESRGRDTLRTGVVTSTIVGVGMVAAGVGLIIAGNKRRKRAIDAHEKSLSYTISPSFNAKGGGATLEMKF